MQPFGGGAQPAVVLSHPVAFPADVHDVAVVQQAFDKRRRHHCLAEDATPSSKPWLEFSIVDAPVSGPKAIYATAFTEVIKNP